MMRGGAQELLLNLVFSEDNPEQVNKQLVAHMRPDLPPEKVLDVMSALAALSAANWPGADKYFRLYLQVFPELWLDEVAKLPLPERAVSVLQTLRGMDVSTPPKAARVAETARQELERRGVSVPEGAVQ